MGLSDWRLLFAIRTDRTPTFFVRTVGPSVMGSSFRTRGRPWPSSAPSHWGRSHFRTGARVTGGAGQVACGFATRTCNFAAPKRSARCVKIKCQERLLPPLLKISVEFGFCDFAGQIGDKPVGAFDPCFAAVSGKERMACHFVKN